MSVEKGLKSKCRHSVMHKHTHARKHASLLVLGNNPGCWACSANTRLLFPLSCALLCVPVWLVLTYRHPPASAYRELGLQTRSSTSRFSLYPNCVMPICLKITIPGKRPYNMSKFELFFGRSFLSLYSNKARKTKINQNV